MVIMMAAAAYARLKEEGLITARLIGISVLVSLILYWTAPMVLFIENNKLLGL